MAPHRKQRRRGDLPAGWQWRDGRPRWIPSPALRTAGWKGRDLKEAGRWLALGPSIEAAKAIAAAVQAWRAGQPVPAELADSAPRGAAAAGRRAAAEPHSIGALLAAYMGAPDTGAKPSHEFAGLAPKTRQDYRNKLKRLVDVLSGCRALPDPADAAAAARHQARTALVLSRSVFALEPEETPAGMVNLLYDAYWTLRETAGMHMASGVLAAASAWLAWCHRHKSRRIQNWALDVERETPPGRIRPLKWPEVQALVWAAEQLRLWSMADAIILGIDLSWSQVDRLALTWDRARGGRCRTARQKTGRVGGTPLLELGRKRLAQILRRQRRMPARPTHVLWCERTGAPWKPDHYRHVFGEEVRPLAATRCPSLADATDADLRDTAVTYARNAGLTIEETCSRTLQSRTRVLALWDKAYGEIGEEIADAGAAKMNAHMRKRGMVL
jgi:hypothetical protein